MNRIERSVSDFLRTPRDVMREVADSDVLLRRRGAPALWLTRADREQERAEAFALVGRTLRNIAAHHPDALIEVLPDVLPWIEFLPGEDKETFVGEFTRTVLATTALDNYGPLIQLLLEWQHTAEAHADPRLAARLRRPVTPRGSQVPRPTN